MAKKLFIWHDVLTDYTSGMACAMAHNVEQARKLILEQAAPYERETLERDISKEPTLVFIDKGASHVWGGG